MSQAVITRLECLVYDVARVNRPNRRHRRVRSPVREADLTAHGIVQIARIFVRLLTEGLDRLPRIDVFKRHFIDPKIVLPDHIKLDLTGAKAIIQKPLNDLRGISIFKADRLQDKVILEPLSHITCADMDDNTRVLSVRTTDVVAQQPVKHRNKISRLAPVRADRRLNHAFVVAVEEWTVAIRQRQLARPYVRHVTPP